MDLRRQLAVLRSWAKWIVLGAFIAGIAAYGVSLVLPKTYEADTRILVGQALQSSSPDVDQFQSAINLSQTYGEIAQGRTLLEQVMADTGIDEAIEAFEKRITVSTSDQQPFIDIVARGDSEDQAAAIANAVAANLLQRAASVGEGDDAVLSFVNDDLKAMQVQITEMRAEIKTLLAVAEKSAEQEARLEALESRLVSLRATYAALLQTTTRSESNRLAVIDPAVPPPGPASPRPLMNMLIAAILGILAMIAVAFVWETLDDRLRTVEDVERVTGLSTLGVIMRMPEDRGRQAFYRLATLLYPRSPAAEAFRSLRTNVEFASLDERFRTILVTSSGPAEGKTMVASNLAVAYAQSGRRVILLDADLRKPAVHAMFGLRNDRGLTDLARTDDLDLRDVMQRTEEANLAVVTSGILPANPAELLGSHRMQETLARIREAADLLIIDTPPVGVVTDAAVLASQADATLFVIRGQRTSERLARRGYEALAKVGAHTVGAVLNDVQPRTSDAVSYYGSYLADETTPVTPVVDLVPGAWNGPLAPGGGSSSDRSQPSARSTAPGEN